MACGAWGFKDRLRVRAVHAGRKRVKFYCFGVWRIRGIGVERNGFFDETQLAPCINDKTQFHFFCRQDEAFFQSECGASATRTDAANFQGFVSGIFDEKRTDTSVFEKAKTLGREFVIQVKGTVIERESKNPNMPTGEIEILLRFLGFA